MCQDGILHLPAKFREACRKQNDRPAESERDRARDVVRHQERWIDPADAGGEFDALERTRVAAVAAEFPESDSKPPQPAARTRDQHREANGLPWDGSWGRSRGLDRDDRCGELHVPLDEVLLPRAELREQQA